MIPNPEQCRINRVHPGGRVHAEHMDESFTVPRDRSLPSAAARRTYTFPIMKRRAELSLSAPIESLGVTETADYTVQHWAVKLWRVHSVHRCEICGEVIELGSYLVVSVFTLEEQPLIVQQMPDGSVTIE